MKSESKGRKKTIVALVLCLAMIPDAAVFALEGNDENTDPAVADAVAEEVTEGITEEVTEESKTYSMEGSQGAQSTTTKATSSTTRPTTAVKKLPIVKRFSFSGWDTTFKSKVDRNRFLPTNTTPTKFILIPKRKSLTIKWKKPKALKSIDGYIVLRKVGKGNRYYEYKRLPKKQTSFTDTKAKKKNTKYAYMVVGYKKGKIIRVGSFATPWVVGYTTASKGKNLIKTTITNAKSIKTLTRGATVKARAKVPKNTLHKYLRWYSSNTRVATITNAGILKAVAPGTATITVRTATGRVTRTKIKVKAPAPKPTMLKVMQSWVGYSEKNKKHRKIIDIYNSHKPHPRNYKVKYSDAWCDACVSAAAIASGNVGAVGLECGVPSHVSIFKKKGIWLEDGTIKPKPGDIIVFAWSKSRQPNNASASHIGIVESVSKGKITTIEGNYKDMVGRRTISVGWGYIRGYARPNYVK